MAKFKCVLCSTTLELSKHTIKVVDVKAVSPEAMCCGLYMESVREGKGFGTIMSRPGGKVRGKSGLTTD